MVDKPITEADIENLVQDVAEPSRDSPTFDQSDNSDIEQDFVSSVVSRPHKHARVHWGELPKKDGHIDHDVPSCEENETACTDSAVSENIVVENRSPPQKEPELLKHFSLEDSHTVNCQETVVPSQPETENTPASDSLSITQVGMSKKGAAGLKGLLKDHYKAKSAPKAINLCLVEHLRETFMEWKTEESMKFLHGPGYTSETELKAQQVEDGQEELDEDDLDEAEVEEGVRQSVKGLAKPSAPAPDFNTLRQESEQLELRVKEFYKGVCVLPEELETDSVKEKVDTEVRCVTFKCHECFW